MTKTNKIRIINTSDKSLNRSYDSQWRTATSTPNLPVGGTCSTSQSTVDAIAAAMDGSSPQENIASHSLPDNAPQLSTKDQDIALMMQNYIRQNGGIVMNDENPKIKKNQTLLG